VPDDVPVPHDLHAATFVPYEGTTFAVVHPDGGDPVPLTLAAVVAAAEQANAPRVDPFSLWFTGPPEVGLAQGLWTLDHDVLGRLAVFLVPRKPEADGLPRYEAVFN
jgi:hypothetical protein